MTACVICRKEVTPPFVFVCLGCRRPCRPAERELDTNDAIVAGPLVLRAIVSDCCHVEVQAAEQLVCSKECRGTYLERLGVKDAPVAVFGIRS